METKTEKITNSKVNYDARLNYYSVVEKLLQGIVQAGMNNDLETEFNLLRDLFSMINPYIPKEETELTELLDRIKNLLELSGQGHSRERLNPKEIKQKLYEFKKEFYKAAKHIWLPTQEKENDEYDFEDILKGNE